MLEALFLGINNWILPTPIVSIPFSCFPSIQDLLRILRCRVVCFADSLFRRSFSPTFQVSLVFDSGTLDSSFRHVFDGENVGGCFLGTLELGGFSLGWWVFMCILALLLVWYYGMELTPLSSVLLLLFACSMVRGQEETSTSQARRRRGPRWDTPSASSIISSLSLEELRSYCRIPDNIDIELLDSPTKSTIGEGDGVVYFTQEQLAVGL